MYVLVTYDVSTKTPAGQRRLREVAKTCLDYGQRVQNSVFEIQIPYDRWVILKDRLLRLINPDEDSLRFYFLGKNWQHKVEHHGAKPSIDITGPLIV